MAFRLLYVKTFWCTETLALNKSRELNIAVLKMSSDNETGFSDIRFLYRIGRHTA